MAEPHPASSRGPLDDERLPRLGDVVAGKYRLERIVGRGGMGVVFAAQHLTLGQSVAIKVLSVAPLDAERRAEATARFMREGQAAARLTSNHVVRVYDVGTLDSGDPFMVMELLRGEDAGSLLENQGSPPIEAAVDYVVQACDAVGEAHRAGVIHRDLKPSNLFVSLRSDGGAHVKVLDFGISKAVPGAFDFDGNLTQTRSVVGSPYYMSPEQVRDSKRVDARTDIWSLGMILYEFLAGEPAFNADTLPGICAAIAADVPVPVGLRRPEVSRELEAVVMRCLEKDPAKRFPSVEELSSALLPFTSRAGAPSLLSYASKRDGPSKDPAALRARRDYPTVPLGEGSGTRKSANAAELAATSHRVPPDPETSTSTLVSSADRTQLPAGPEATPAAPGSAAPRRVMSALALLVVMAGASWTFLRSKETPPEPAAPAPQVELGRFELTLESVPAGATVFENDRVLGTTPLEFAVNHADVTPAPRRFTLRLEGYAPYVVEQGKSERDVHVVAHLQTVAPSAPLPPPAAVVAPSASSFAPPPPAVAPPRPRPAPRPAPRSSATANTAGTKPEPSSEIRLER